MTKSRSSKDRSTAKKAAKPKSKATSPGRKANSATPDKRSGEAPSKHRRRKMSPPSRKNTPSVSTRTVRRRPEVWAEGARAEIVPRAKPRGIAVDRKRPPHILVLECDPERLIREGITIAGDLANDLDTPELRGRVHVVRARSQKHLLKEFAKLAEAGRQFELVAVVGHALPSGLGLFAGPVVPWQTVGMWLAPFHPERLIFFACHAGKWAASAALFRRLDRLSEVWGSPIVANGTHLRMLADVLFVLAVGRKSPEAVAASVVNVLETQGLIVRWTKDTIPNKIESILAQTVAEAALDKWRKQLQGLVRDARDAIIAWGRG